MKIKIFGLMLAMFFTGLSFGSILLGIKTANNITIFLGTCGVIFNIVTGMLWYYIILDKK